MGNFFPRLDKRVPGGLRVLLCLGIIAVLAARVTTFKIIPSMSLLRVHLCTVPVHRHHVTLRLVPASRYIARRLTLRLQMEKGNTHSGTDQSFERRDTVRRMALAFALGAGVGCTRSAAADSNAAGLRVVPENDMEFHQQWVYSKPQDILPYIYATAAKGQPEEVLQAMDEFGRHYPMYKLGDEKGAILEREILKMNAPPKNALEIGTFLGYSALRTARRLAAGGRLHCIEYNPEHAQVAQEVLKWAGLEDRVEVIVGDSSVVLPQVGKAIGPVDYVLLDHRKSLYLPDLQALEKLGVVVKGTLVVADNVIYPGAPDYLAYVQSAAWDTKLVDAKFEYDLWWKEGWSPKADALSFSIKLK